MDGQVPTVRRDIRVPEVGEIGGQAAKVRRLSRTDRVNIMTAAAFDGTPAGEARLQAMLVRTGLTCVDGLVNPDTGARLEYTGVRHPLLGEIASDAVYDAMNDELLRAVADELLKSQLSAERAKN